MTAREKLLNLNDVYDQEGSSEIFMQAMRDCLKHHMNNSDFFNKYATDLGFHPDALKTEADLKNIPMIHAN